MERCAEHGQQIVAIDSDRWSGETRFCTRDAWDMGWISGRNPWPSARRGYQVGEPPDDGTMLECECLCGHLARSTWGAMVKDGGRLRCEQCRWFRHDPATGRPPIARGRLEVFDEWVATGPRRVCQSAGMPGAPPCAGEAYLVAQITGGHAGSDGYPAVLCRAHYDWAAGSPEVGGLLGWWDGGAWQVLRQGELPPPPRA